MTKNPFNQITTSIEELYALCEKQVEEVADEEKVVLTKNYADKPYDRYFWNDGSGNEATIIFPHNGGALLFGYDNESDLNTFGTNPPVEQIVFKNIPKDYEQYLKDGSLFWDWDDTNTTYATCAAWLVSNKWKYNKTVYRKQEVSSIPFGGFSNLFNFLSTNQKGTQQ